MNGAKKTGAKIWSRGHIYREELRCAFCGCAWWALPNAEPEACPYCGTIYNETIFNEEE